MEKLPKYAMITIDNEAFSKVVVKGIKEAIKKHGVSRLTYEILNGLANAYETIDKRDDSNITLSDTQKIESVLAKGLKPSTAKLFLEDKFSKNNVTEVSYAHKAVKEVYSYYVDNIEATISGTHKDLSLVATYLEDFSLHFKLAVAILSKKIAEAKEIAVHMDTHPREFIPNDVYKYVTDDVAA